MQSRIRCRLSTRHLSYFAVRPVPSPYYLPQEAHAQQKMKVQKNRVRNLVFKGGSAKGIAYFGCLTKLEQIGVDLSKVEQVIGTSAGALAALFVCLNLHENREKLEICFDKDFTEFLDPTNASLKTGILEWTEASLFNKVKTATAVLLEYYSSECAESLGLVSGDAFLDWLEPLIHAETGLWNCTFQELGEIEKFKSLWVVATDLDAESPLIFSKERTPTAIISDSIRSSTSIPLLFAPHRFWCKNRETGLREVPEEWERHRLVDGSVILNYPMKIFDELTCPALPDETLGFYLTEKEQIGKYSIKFPPNSKEESEEIVDAILNLAVESPLDDIADFTGSSSYPHAVYSSFEGGQGAAHAIYEKEFDRTIYVDNLNISSLKLSLSPDEKASLIEEGQKAVSVYFGEGEGM